MLLIKNAYTIKTYAFIDRDMDEGGQAPEVQTIRGHPFVVGPRYHCIEFIGEGAYGIVIKASDNQADPANGENFGKSIITLILFYGEGSYIRYSL